MQKNIKKDAFGDAFPLYKFRNYDLLFDFYDVIDFFGYHIIEFHDRNFTTIALFYHIFFQNGIGFDHTNHIRYRALDRKLCYNTLLTSDILNLDLIALRNFGNICTDNDSPHITSEIFPRNYRWVVIIDTDTRRRKNPSSGKLFSHWPVRKNVDFSCLARKAARIAGIPSASAPPSKVTKTAPPES